MAGPVVAPSRHRFLRVRYQLVGGLLFAIALPVLLRSFGGLSIISAVTTQNTVLAALTAHVLGFLAFRRIGSFPGVAAAGFILPTFALSYGLVFAVIFFFRIDYSRFQAGGSFILSTLWYFGWSIAMRRVARYRLAVVPGGNVAGIERIENVVWHHLTSPDQPPIGVTGIVADLTADLSDAWERYIADAALAGIPVYHVKQVIESLTGRAEIEHLSENTLGSLNPNQFYLSFKEVADRAAALLVLVGLSPLFAVIAAAIRLDTPGPVLFRQQRMGYRGEIFTVYKFRSMAGEPVSEDDRENAMTRPEDDRVTRVGRVLRNFRLDELPQAINILRGEMSWIGPRPEALALSRWYEAELPFYRYRHIVRPGITGWAQVNQGHVTEVGDVLEKLHYDFYYIKNFSPWLDLVIILRTIRVMVTGQGAR
ncbi:polyprenyl glycosylphosphotransferase [Aquibium carbonis]|uniref:Polyprenyl glycosylphosphotransferase n=1 Tax=Aquibium carbonis TaxID=2495581 RepID=A0A429YUR0_9HYPH|nr:sugar transferase [Aquibium carbonis]RST85177.1 polyprenyl glycosylphosphotransferase [Aquibium carbonis]